MRGRIVSGLGALALAACGGSGGGGGGAASDAVVDAGSGLADAAHAPTDAGGDAAPVADAAPMADASPDMGAPACPASGFGPLGPSVTLDAGDKPRHSPRATWTGSEWGVVWLADQAEGPGEVRFRRVGGDGAPIGEPVVVGRARSPQYEVVWNGTAYVVAWLAAPTPDDSFQGIRVQALTADGMPAGPASDVQQTHDVDRLTAAWPRLGTGLIAYTRGAGGAGGVFTTGLDEGAQPTRTVHVADGPARSPSLTYGNGSFGLAWLDPSSQRPADVVFALLNDFGEPLGGPHHDPDAGAQVSLGIAFGGDAFGIAWSAADAMGGLGTRLSLVAAADGEIQATPDVPGPTAYGHVDQAAWIEGGPGGGVYGVAWEDTAPDGGVRLGVTGLNHLGQVKLGPATVDTPAGSRPGELSIAGNASRLGAFFTLDPTPQPAGLSPAAHIEMIRLGPCHR
jgi:hypothetical protein